MVRARVALAAALTVLAVVTLAGCRSVPNVAAYMGDRTFTEDSVNRVVDQFMVQVEQTADKPSLGLGLGGWRTVRGRGR
jgi:hypothetical protein